MPQEVNTPSDAGDLYYRHTLPVRVMHWINVVALTILLMSGLQIFNAYPELHWGKASSTGPQALLQISARDGANGQTIGYTRILGREFDTTGVLGASRGPDGAVARALRHVLLRRSDGRRRNRVLLREH